MSGGLYTKEEREALNKFRPTVEQYLTLDYQKSDGYLLRWLRGNDFNLTAAAESLAKNREWRDENKIDSILDKNEVIPSDLPYTVSGVDKAGRPIALQPFGKWNLKKYADEGKSDVVVRQYQRTYEEAIRKAFSLAAETGKDIDQIYVLSDMDGYSQETHGCEGCVKITLDVARSFNAGVIPFAGNITIVNDPRAFQPVLDQAKDIVEKTIENYDDKQVWKQKILNDIDADQLPVNLGGTRSS